VRAVRLSETSVQNVKTQKTTLIWIIETTCSTQREMRNIHKKKIPCQEM
jgi:hypothetical protein